MASFDQTEFLNTTYYFFDFLCGGLVLDVRDSLMFSEDNIDEKFRHAVQALKTKNLSPDEYDHDLEQITLRFKISLPTTARYSALVSLITGVAWSAEYLNAHLKVPLRGRRNDADFGLRRLQYLDEQTSLGRDTTLQNYGNLVGYFPDFQSEGTIVRLFGSVKRRRASTHSPLPLPDRNLLVLADEGSFANCSLGLRHTWVFDVREPTNPVSFATMPVPTEADYAPKAAISGPIMSGRTDREPSKAPASVTAVAKFLLIAIERKLRPANFASQPALTVVIMELAMINWPEMLHHSEDWAAGFWAGVGAASLMVIAGVGMVLLARGI